MKEFEQTLFFDVEEFEEPEAIAIMDADLQGEDDPKYITPKHNHVWKIEEVNIYHHDLVCHCGERREIKGLKTHVIAATLAINKIIRQSSVLTDFAESAAGEEEAEEIRASLNYLHEYVGFTEHALRDSGVFFDNTPSPVIEKVQDKVKVDGLNQYKCKGSENKYWRYSYRVNGKLKHLHIRGGNARTPLIKKRVATIQALINEGTTHEAIARLIKAW